uniref:Riboflavin kinase n=1 Tax=Thermofilum pendens TaxID=2269 RepID=A0A7C3WU30_THEPE
MTQNLDYELLPLLLELAQRGCTYTPRRISKVEIAKTLGVSSWKLNKLLQLAEDEGYLEKQKMGRVFSYQLTPRSLMLLNRVHRTLSMVLKTTPLARLRGVVVPGLGEGAFYMSISKYLEAFKEILGYEPYTGTLNLKLDSESTEARRKLREIRAGYRIEGFSVDGREYCGVTVYKAVITGNGISISGAVLDIDKTKHGDEILEVIAPVKLRDVLKLRDGDRVEVTVLG